MTETEQLLEAIKFQSQQIENMTQAIGVMASVMGEMLEELASQNAQDDQKSENNGYLDGD